MFKKNQEHFFLSIASDFSLPAKPNVTSSLIHNSEKIKKALRCRQHDHIVDSNTESWVDNKLIPHNSLHESK